MGAASAGVNSPVDKFFEFSLLGLLASGFLAVVGSGYLDAPTIMVTAAALVVRLASTAGFFRLDLPASVVTAATVAYIGFYPIDYYYISRAFIPAAIHLVFFVAVTKILTARSNRDYVLLKLIAFLELLAACIVSSRFNFLLFLLLFLVLGVATFASGEIRRSWAFPHFSASVSSRAVSSRLAGAAVFISTGIVVITVALFFFLPRTARAAFQHLVSHRYHLAGFSDHVSLGEIGEIKKENTPVMHVRMDHPEDRSLALKWRGAALSEFNGRAWFNPPNRGTILRPDARGLLLLNGDELAQRRREGRHISYAVHLSELAGDALFFAGAPEFVRIDSTVVQRPSGNYSLLAPDSRAISYQVYSLLDSTPSRGDVAAPGSVPPLSPGEHNLFLQLPARTDPRIRKLAQLVVSGESSPALQAQRVEVYLRSHYGYTLELPPSEPEDPIAFFLFHRKKGHCEYFASAMAVMLRTIEIPSRVVTGFESGVYNPISGTQLIRTSDAHSWVEAWLPERGWTTFDPTPPDPNPPSTSLWTRLGFYTDAAEVFWQDWVLNYDLDHQLQLASRMGRSGRQMGSNWFDGFGIPVSRWWKSLVAMVERYRFFLLGAFMLGASAKLFGADWWHWWNTRRRVQRAQRGEAQASDATLLYERMLKILRRRGIEKPAWLTPFEFAQIMPQPELSALVEDLTQAYNELRFGHDARAAGRMIALLEQLETAR